MQTPAYVWRARIGPEAIALALSLVLIVVVALAPNGPLLTDLPGSQAEQRPSAPPASPSAAPTELGQPIADIVERGLLLNGRLVKNGDALVRLLAAERVAVPDIVDELRVANQNLGNARAWTAELGARPAGRDVAEQLGAAYDAVARRIDAALDRPLGDKKGYVAAATRIAKELRDLASFEAALGDLVP